MSRMCLSSYVLVTLLLVIYAHARGTIISYLARRVQLCRVAIFRGSSLSRNRFFRILPGQMCNLSVSR